MDQQAALLQKYQILKQEFAKKPIDSANCLKLLNELKILLANQALLPIADASIKKQDLLLARDVLELGTQIAVELRDAAMFERHINELRTYYLDYRNEASGFELPDSAHCNQLLGLNLLYLLATNRLAEFHSELELLAFARPDAIESIYVTFSVKLEQCLMEGSYNKIFLAKDLVPDKSYVLFTEKLFETVREEIATCLETAYERIEVREAARMLNLADAHAVSEFAARRVTVKRGDLAAAGKAGSFFEWTVRADGFMHFRKVALDAVGVEQRATDRDRDSTNVVSNEDSIVRILAYAKELETIV